MQTVVQNENFEKQWGMLVAQAWCDPELKARLLEDSATVLREYGIDIPYGIDVRVVEDSANVRHLVLPCSPEEEMVDEELMYSVGRDSFSGFSYGCGGCGRCGRCGCGCDYHDE